MKILESRLLFQKLDFLTYKLKVLIYCTMMLVNSMKNPCSQLMKVFKTVKFYVKVTTRWSSVSKRLQGLSHPIQIRFTVIACALQMPSISILLVVCTVKVQLLQKSYAIDMRLPVTYGKMCPICTMLGQVIAAADSKDTSMYSVGVIVIVMNLTQWRNSPSFQTQICRKQKNGSSFPRVTWQICQYQFFIYQLLSITRKSSSLAESIKKRTRFSFLTLKLTQFRVLT